MWESLYGATIDALVDVLLIPAVYMFVRVLRVLYH